MNHPRHRCPVCGKARSDEHTPFCSTRCRDRDLVRWLDDGYAIPGPPADPDNDRVSQNAFDEIEET